MSDDDIAWEELLSSAARLHRIIPDAVMVGGSAAALHAAHRFSTDHDHVLPDLEDRFDDVLGSLESVAGWRTARVNRPVLILGSLDGIETGVRQLIRSEPLEVEIVSVGEDTLTVPTKAEILRIKAILILRRNATRDYVDFAALGSHIGFVEVEKALSRFDDLYPQDNGQSALQQLLVQLSKPVPYDLDSTDLSNYKGLDKKWGNWSTVSHACGDIAIQCFRSFSSDQDR